MAIRTPDVGEEAMLTRILGPDMTLKLFKNDVELGLSAAQKEALDETDFQESTFTGYADVPLIGTDDPHTEWTITPGDPTVGEYTQQTFESTADQTVEAVRGYYVVRDSDGGLEFYEYLTPVQNISLDGQQIKITPKYTYKGTED